MKRKTLFTVAVTALMLGVFCLFIRCSKDLEGSHFSKSLKLNDELAKLYQEVPIVDFGKISLVNGDILRFESKEHYLKVYDALLEQYDAWSELFFAKYDNDDEDKLDEIIDQLGFDDCTPLLMFEEKYGIAGNNLRAVNVTIEEDWLAKGAQGAYPFDEIVICNIEQALVSKHYEICIGDTILQMRPDGFEVLIPLSAIKYLPEIRSASSMSELQKLMLKVGGLFFPPPYTGCYKSVHNKTKTEYHPENEKRFDWSYQFRYRQIIGARTTVTMKNFKFKNNTWKKDNAICALGFSTQLYRDEGTSCQKSGNYGRTRGTPHKAYSKSRHLGANAGTAGTVPQEKLRDDTNTSDIECRHNGWTFIYTAEGTRKQ